MISPKKVMTTVEKMNATAPTITELDSSVSKTLMPTFPHKMVVSKKLESSLSFATFMALRLFFFDSTCKRSLVILKNARLRPENIADWVIQKIIPSHIMVFIFRFPSFNFCHDSNRGSCLTGRCYSAMTPAIGFVDSCKRRPIWLKSRGVFHLASSINFLIISS